MTLDAANRLTGSYEELINGSGTVIGTLWEGLYGYDNADRLTSFQPFPMEQCLAPPATNMTYDVDNQLATYNNQSVSHDLDGNLLSAPVNGTLLGTLGWDARDRLLSAGGVTYTYDAENRRVSSTINGQTTQYIWSRGSLDQLLAKINPDGSVTRYIYGKGLLYEETTNVSGTAQSPVYYHFDWRGDTVALSDSNGNVTARLSYNAYGERTVMSGTVITPFCFNGKWGVLTEPSGLLAMQARFYSPVLRRFLSEDPSGFNGGTNMYAYGAGDPMNLMDPFGLGPVETASNLGAGAADAIDPSSIAAPGANTGFQPATSFPYTGPIPNGCAIGTLQNLYAANNATNVPSVTTIQTGVANYWATLDPGDPQNPAAANVGVTSGVTLGALAGVVKTQLPQYGYSATLTPINSSNPSTLQNAVSTYNAVGLSTFVTNSNGQIQTNSDGSLKTHAIMYDGANVYTTNPIAPNGHATVIPMTAAQVIATYKLSEEDALVLTPKH